MLCEIFLRFLATEHGCSGHGPTLDNYASRRGTRLTENPAHITNRSALSIRPI
jgi:hypothetical protein